MRFLLFCLCTVLLTWTGCHPAESSVPQSTREVIQTDNAPAPAAAYSQAIKVGDMIFCAGQIGRDPETRQLVEGGVQAETRQAMENLSAVLEAGGFTLADAVQVQVFLADIEEFSAMNEVYSSFFDGAPPARAAIQAGALPLGARVEIMLTAAR